MTWPRALLLLLACIAIAAFAQLLYQVLSVVQLTVLQGVFLVLCTMCFAWIALGTSSAVLGFVAMFDARRKRRANSMLRGAASARTALLFPGLPGRYGPHRRDHRGDRPGADRAGRREAVRHLRAERQPRSATSRRASCVPCASCAGACAMHARSTTGARPQNVGKKAGNIADWVQRFGGAYESFIILDADSIMSGGLLVHLQSLMAASPKAGLIQTVPRLVGADTLFARLQQFAVAFYGPVVAAGFAAWYQASGNYWGHNAIVRTRAFADAAGLADPARSRRRSVVTC